MSDDRSNRPETGEVRKSRNLLAVAATMAILAATVMGCGKNVQSVSGPGTDERPMLVTVPHGGTPGDFLGHDGSQSNTATETISARSGGKIVCGRHTLKFAPGALAQDTEITLVDATIQNGFVSAECYPEGLQFQATVTLETDFSDLASPAGYDMYWMVPTADGVAFVNMDGQVSPSGKGVITTLQHFSCYAPGKGGW